MCAVDAAFGAVVSSAGCTVDCEQQLAVQIVTALELGQPGPVLGKLTALAKRWQYANVDRQGATNGSGTADEPPAELVQYLKERMGQ